MKNKFFKLIMLAVLVSTIFSCKDDDNAAPVINFLYLSKTADIVFDEELSAVVTANDDNQLSYTWECSGGEIIGSGNEVKWKAPKNAGTFTIKVNVSDGKKIVSSTKNVSVAGSYIFTFNQTSPTWVYNSTYTNRIITEGVFTIFSKDSTNYGSYAYNLESDLPLPYSIKTKIAINADNIISNTTPRIQLNFGLTTISDGNNYLKVIMLYIYPTTNQWALRSGVYNVATSSYDYQNIYVDSYSNSKAIFTESNQYHTLGMSIDLNKNLVISLDGQELYTTIGLATNPIYNRELKLSYFSYSVAPGLKLLIDDFYLTTDGTVLK